MEYKNEVLDRRTGELVSVSIGDWITISELGSHYDVGRREVRTILRRMEFLHVEGGRNHQRHRLCDWVVEKGWGKRLQRKNGNQTIPFDVIGPEAQSWIAGRWSATVEAIETSRSAPALSARAALVAFRDERNRFRATVGRDEMAVEEQVSWLAYYFPALTQVVT